MTQSLPPASFTFRYPKRTKEVKTPVKIAPEFDPNMERIEVGEKVNMDANRPHKNEFLAIWDTGATNTCITQKAVISAGLPQIGVTNCQGVYGKIEKRPLYMGCLYLPNKVCVNRLPLIEIDSLPGADLLIGMDIIGAGDFALSLESGNTVFSFRFPSAISIDFVQTTHSEKIGRYDPCFCGSGKKFKFCHSK
jgi:hypothetical protein